MLYSWDMKILYSITKSEIGGAQMHVLYVMRHMKSLGHEVALVALPGGWLEHEAKKLGVIFYPNRHFENSFNPIRLALAYNTIKKAVKDFEPHIVHSHSSFAGFLTRLAVRNKIPSLFTAHSWAFTDGTKWSRKLIAPIAERFVAKYTTKIICVSEYDRKLALRYKIASPEKLVVVHNGVEPATSYVPGGDVVVTVGRLAYPKEYALLLEAFHKVDLPQMKLEVISDGPHRGMIEEKIKELGLEEKVTLLGELSSPETRDRLMNAGAFVLISKHEGFPMSILEAMAAGLPVIASNVGGIPEQIDEASGILVNNTVDEIVSALKRLADEETRIRMGQAAKKRFEEHFSLEKFLKHKEDIYRDLR